MALPLMAAGLITSGLSGLAKTILGADQAAEGRALLKSAVRPEYDIQDEYYDNVSISNNMAQSGIPAATRDFYNTQSERGLTSSTDAVLRTGGGMNSIADIYDRYNQGNARMAAQDAELRLGNLRNLMEQNKTLAGQKTIKWSLDEYEPYKDKVRAGNAAVTAGTNNFFTGLSGITSTLANAAIAQSQKDEGGGAPSPTTSGFVPRASDSYFDAGTPAPDADPALNNYIDNLLKFRTNNSMLA